MGGTLRALGYARISLPEEHIENQINAIEEFSKSNNIELLKVFQDVGVSGSKPALEREGFKQLLEASRLLDVKTIIIYDLTRLGRDLFDLVNTYSKLLSEGYNVLFVKHPELNTKPDSIIGDALRKALLSFLGAMAELERAFIRERTRAGMKRAKEQGKQIGRPPYPFPKEKIMVMLKQGKSIADIWRLLKERGEICRETKSGKRSCISYERFRRKVKALRGSHR